MRKVRNGTNEDLNTVSLDCESDMLPLSYHAPESISI